MYCIYVPAGHEGGILLVRPSNDESKTTFKLFSLAKNEKIIIFLCSPWPTNYCSSNNRSFPIEIGTMSMFRLCKQDQACSTCGGGPSDGGGVISSIQGSIVRSSSGHPTNYVFGSSTSILSARTSCIVMVLTSPSNRLSLKFPLISRSTWWGAASAWQTSSCQS